MAIEIKKKVAEICIRCIYSFGKKDLTQITRNQYS